MSSLRSDHNLRRLSIGSGAPVDKGAAEGRPITFDKPVGAMGEISWETLGLCTQPKAQMAGNQQKLMAETASRRYQRRLLRSSCMEPRASWRGTNQSALWAAWKRGLLTPMRSGGCARCGRGRGRGSGGRGALQATRGGRGARRGRRCGPGGSRRG